MRIPFNLYDFLGYTVPGLIVIIILAILINPELLSNLPDELKDKDSELAQFLRPTVTQGILYVVVCYLVGFATDGLVYWLFGKLASIFGSIMRFHSREGWFEKTLLDCRCRGDSDKFSPYTDEFVENFKVKIEEVFGIKVETVREEAEKAKNAKRYIEIFDLCRTTVLKQSPDVYSRGFTLLAQYNSAKLMGSIFFLATVGFWLMYKFNATVSAKPITTRIKFSFCIQSRHEPGFFSKNSCSVTVLAMATDLNLVFGACIALDKEGSQRKRQAKRKKTIFVWLLLFVNCRRTWFHCLVERRG